MDTVEKQRKHFESISETYYHSRQEKNHLLLKELMWAFFFRDKQYLKKEGLSVLEPMCGYAQGKDLLETFLQPDLLYEGFDYSATLVDIVRQRTPAITISCGDVTTFRSPRTFDLIILLGGLHHVYVHAGAVVGKLHQALNAAGYFISLEPTHDNILFRNIRERIYRKNPLFDDDTERAFELDELNSVFQANGFFLVDQIYPGLLSYVLYYNPDAFPKLNLGGSPVVKALFQLDSLFFRNYIGKKLSFATLSLWRKKT
jgi:SAM-dependent methyltransferase